MNKIIRVVIKKINMKDFVIIILRYDIPLILHEVDEHVELVRDYYIDGIMEGEAVEWEDGKKIPATYRIL
jgi:hypothetical protein